MSALFVPKYDDKTGLPLRPLPTADDAAALHKRMDSVFRGIGAALKFDSAGGIALERELTKISAYVSLQPLGVLTSFDHFPLTPDRPEPGQKAYTATGIEYSQNRVSRTYTDRGGSATVNRKILATNKITPYIQTADYTINDLYAATLANVGLPPLLMEVARRAVMEEINSDNWQGNDDEGITGVYNNTDVNKSVVANGASGSPLWVNKTPQEIFNDCQTLLQEVWNAILGGATDARGRLFLRPNRLVMSTTSYALIAGLRIATNFGQTVLQVLEESFKAAYDPDFRIVSAPELITGGGPGGSDKWMLAYRYDPEVAGRVVALDGTFAQPDIRSLTTSIPFHAQAGGVSIRYPVAMRIKYGM